MYALAAGLYTVNAGISGFKNAGAESQSLEAESVPTAPLGEAHVCMIDHCKERLWLSSRVRLLEEHESARAAEARTAYEAHVADHGC